MVTIEELKMRFDGMYSKNSQKHNEAMSAVKGVEAALTELAKHGHLLTLSDDKAPIGPQFPKMLYLGKATMVVLDEEEEEAAKKKGFASLHAPDPMNLPGAIDADLNSGD